MPQRIREQNNATDAPAISPVAVALANPAVEAEALPSLETVQRQYIQQVLAATEGNKRRAADILGITRRTLYRWLE